MTQRRGRCPSCSKQTLEYESVHKGGSGYVDVLFCPSCQYFINGRDKDYNRVHNQAFPPTTADEGYNRKAAQIERVTDYFAGRCLAISPGVVGVRVAVDGPDWRD